MEPLTGFGNKNARFLIIDECPSEDDMLLRKPLTNLAGKHFVELFQEADVKSSLVYFTYAVRHYFKGKFSKEFEPYRRDLWNTMKSVNPEIIIALGANVAQTLLRTPKSKFRLSDVAGKRQAVDYFSADIVPWYRPEWVLNHGKKASDETVAVWKEFLTR